MIGNIQYNKLDQATSIQKDAQGKCILPRLSGPAGGKGCATDLACYGCKQHHAGPQPGAAAIQQIKAGSHARQHEEERKQDHQHNRVEARAEGSLPLLVPWQAHSS